MTISLTKKVVITMLILSFLLYSAYLYLNLPFAAVPGDPLADRGKMLWQRHNCTACHQVYGLGGYLGPDLTNVYSKKGPVYINAFLAHGTSVMPDFKLTGPEMEAITAYLKSVDATGSADPKTFKINGNGTIEQ